MSERDKVSIATVIDTGDIAIKTTEKAKIETPPGFDDVKVKVISAVWAVFVRALRTFLQVLVAGLTGATLAPYLPVVSDAITPSNFSEKIVSVLVIATISALVAAAQRAAEIMGKVDDKMPEWTA